MVDDELTVLNGDEEDENLLEDADYSRKAEFSKASVVEQAISKIKETRSQEMKPGYYNTIQLPNGSIKKTYFPDARKEFIGSVEYLKGLLGHEIRTSAKATAAVKKFEADMEIAFNKYSVSSFESEDEKYIPEVDEIIPTEVTIRDKNNRPIKREIIERQGLYNWRVMRYWNDLVKLYDNLFDTLNLLIAEKDFFRQKSSY